MSQQQTGFLIYPDLNLFDREEKLKATCSKKEMRNYAHTLQQTEVDVEQKKYSEDGIELKKKKDEVKNILDDYKAQIKAIEDRMNERLEKIQFRKRTISGILYGVVNDEENRMMYYDKFGELIEARDLLPDEKKGPLFSQLEKGDKAPGQTINADNMVVNDTTGAPGDQGLKLLDGPGNPELSAQEKMDIESPKTMEHLQLAAKHRVLTPEEQSQLQNFNADSKKAAKKAAKK